MAMTTSTHSDTLWRLLLCAVSRNDGSIGDLVTADVTGWSPNLFVRSRRELVEVLDSRQESFSRIEIDVYALDEIGDKAIAEWHLAADHTGLLVIDEDVVIEPTGLRLHVSGATFAEFDGDRICAFRSYFDDLAFIEQALGERVR